jgi:hypothetical protein
MAPELRGVLRTVADLQTRTTTKGALLASAACLMALAAWITLSASETAPSNSVAQPPEFVDDTLADWVAPIFDLPRTVELADIIVVGQVVGIEGTDVVYPSGYDPKEAEAGGPNPGVVFTRFRVEVQEYLKGSGPPTLTLRLTGDFTKSAGSAELPKPSFGKPMIFVLTADEPSLGEHTYQSGGPWGLLSEENGVMSYAWRADEHSSLPRAVPYFSGMSFAQAVQAVKAEVARQ